MSHETDTTLMKFRYQNKKPLISQQTAVQLIPVIMLRRAVTVWWLEVLFSILEARFCFLTRKTAILSHFVVTPSSDNVKIALLNRP
jgi:hypothetical protein